jgi:hypothetical protein
MLLASLLLYLLSQLSSSGFREQIGSFCAHPWRVQRIAGYEQYAALFLKPQQCK